MRKFSLILSALGVLTALGACADSPMAPDQQHASNSAPGDSPQDAWLQGCVNDGLCVLPPIVVGPGECDPWMNLDWCNEGGTCVTATLPTDPTVTSCPGTGGGGGGTPPPPGSDPPGIICPSTGSCAGEPPPPDTCRTGETVVDDPDVWGQFQDLWMESITKGTERGGWIVREGTHSYRLIPFHHATYGPCGIDVYEPAPAGTVSILHTHPWPLFQATPCGYVNTGTPSPQDIRALQQTGLSTGYFMDARGIGKFTATGGEVAHRIDRCGY